MPSLLLSVATGKHNHRQFCVEPAVGRCHAAVFVYDSEWLTQHTSAGFGRFSHRVFLNLNLTTTANTTRSNVCLHSLVWLRSMDALSLSSMSPEASHIQWLQGILGLCRSATSSIRCLTIQKQLCWTGWVIRMSHHCLHRRVLYVEILEGERQRGGQKKCYSDHVKLSLSKCHIPLDEPKTLAMDRTTWHDICRSSLAAFRTDTDQASEECHMRKHATVNGIPSGRPVTSAARSMCQASVNRAIFTVVTNTTMSSPHQRTTSRQARHVSNTNLLHYHC